MGRHAEGWTLCWREGVAYVRFRHQGKRFMLSTGKRDPEEAPKEAARLYAFAVSGGKRKPRGVVRALAPLDEQFAEWLASLEGVLDPKTIETYTTTYVEGHWLKFFKTLGEVSDEEKLGEYLRARLREVLRSTVRKEKSALTGFQRWAKERGMLSEMPTWPELPAKAKGNRKGKQRQRANELSPAQVETFLAALTRWSERSRKGKHFPVQPRFVIAYETGLRPSTLNEVEWEHLGSGGLTIQDEDDKNRFGREVPLSPRARAVFEELRAEVIELQEGRPAKGLVFGRHDYRSAIQAACTKAEIPLKLAPYDFRHARGTHLVDSGAPLSGVAFLLGHTQVTTTNKYAKANRRAADQAIALGQHAPLLLLPPAVMSPVELLPAASGGLDSGAIRVQPEGSTVRRTGVEPVQELPHWNLKAESDPRSGGKQATSGEEPPSPRPQETAANRPTPQDSGARAPEIVAQVGVTLSPGVRPEVSSAVTLAADGSTSTTPGQLPGGRKGGTRHAPPPAGVTTAGASNGGYDQDRSRRDHVTGAGARPGGGLDPQAGESHHEPAVGPSAGADEPDPWGLRGDVVVGLDPADGDDETVMVRARRRADGRLELLDGGTVQVASSPWPPSRFPLGEAVANLAMLRLGALGGAR